MEPLKPRKPALYWLCKCIGLIGALNVHGQSNTTLNKVVPSQKVYWPAHSVENPSFSEGRPLRVHSLRLAPQLERNKPLAPFDRVGWVSVGPLIIGEGDYGQVICYSIERGERLWSLDSPRFLHVPPLLAGGHVLLGFSDGTLQKVEVATGKVRWSTKLHSPVARKMTLSRDAVYVVTQSQSIHEISLEEGKVKWTVDAGDGYQSVHISSLSAPVLYDGNVYVGLRSGEWIALATRTGQVLNRIDSFPESVERFHDFAGTGVVVTGRMIFARHDGYLGAASMSHLGNLSWKVKKSAISSTAFREGRLYVGLVNGQVYSYEALTGQEFPLIDIGEPAVNIFVGSDTVYLSSQSGNIFALDRGRGSLKWRDSLGSAVVQDPIVVNRTIYFPTSMKVLYGYALSQPDRNGG